MTKDEINNRIIAATIAAIRRGDAVEMGFDGRGTVCVRAVYPADLKALNNLMADRCGTIPCSALTKAGRPCGNLAVDSVAHSGHDLGEWVEAYEAGGYCHLHGG